MLRLVAVLAFACVALGTKKVCDWTDEEYDALPRCKVGLDPCGCKMCNKTRAEMNNLEFCAGASPTYTDGCPSCRPTSCKARLDMSKLPFCQGKLEFDQNGCRSCKPKVCPLKNLPPPCKEGQKVTFDERNCPNCKRPRCNFNIFKKLPDCAKNTLPGRPWDQSCPTCKPLKPVRCEKEQYDKLKPCADGVKAERNELTGCPTCARVGYGCSKKKKCETKDLPVCPKKTRPKLDTTTCCPSCRLDYGVLGHCTWKKRYECPSLEELEICEYNENVFDRKTCCRTCKKERIEVKPRVGKKRCSKADIRECEEATDLCVGGEQPLLDSACCKTCVRPRAMKPLSSIMRCGNYSLEQICEEGQFPQDLFENGQFVCPSCIPARPKCDPTCDKTQVCLWVEGSPKCLDAKEIRLTITSTIVEVKEWVKTVTPDEVCAGVEERVKRLCDTADEDINARCLMFLPWIEGALSCTKTGDETIVKIPEQTTTHSAAQLVADAMASTTGEDLIFTTTEDVSNTNTVSNTDDGSNTGSNTNTVSNTEDGSNTNNNNNLVTESSPSTSPVHNVNALVVGGLCLAAAILTH